MKLIHIQDLHAVVVDAGTGRQTHIMADDGRAVTQLSVEINRIWRL